MSVGQRLASYARNAAYLGAAAAAAPWLAYAGWRRGKHREGWGAKLLGAVPRRVSDRPCAWLHAVSVGEVNLLEPLLARFERDWPEWDTVLSTTTQTGYALARRKYAPRTVFYCPLDFSWAAARALRRIRPRLLLLAELELWPNLIAAARARGVRVAVVNGRLSDRSYRGYRRLGPLIRGTLRRLDLVAAQNDLYAQRFRRLGARPAAVHVTGSLKFDGARTERDNPETQRLGRLAGVRPDDVVFLAGSTQDPEERLALEAFLALRAQHPRLRLILTPRHPERFEEAARVIDQAGLPWRRRSRLDGRPLDPAERILLVDAVGELGAWWGLAQIAYVGGSMGRRGGQNMIEPAAYGAAVCFGPHTHNFRDVVELLLEADAARVVRNGSELVRFVRWCLERPAEARELGARARRLVLAQQGAAERTARLLAPLVDAAASGRRS